MAIYRLTKPLLDLPVGTYFIHKAWDKDAPELGNISYGAMVLAWVNGDCQSRWCGGAFALPGQYADSQYFKKCRGTAGLRISVPKIHKRKPDDEIKRMLSKIEKATFKAISALAAPVATEKGNGFRR